GPLPASVYWRRRIVVIGGALTLVLVLGRVLGGGSDGSSDDPDGAQQVAEQVAGQQTTSTVSGPSGSPTVTRKPRPTKPSSPATTRTPELAAPDGPCDDTDVIVTPSVIGDAIAGRDVVFRLDVRTIVDEACTWRVSADHLSVAITSGSDNIWSTQHCPAALAVQDLVVRRAVTAGITMVWKDTRRSDDKCSKLAGWALPGYYHVAAAALGGEPTDVQFRLTKPTPEVIVQTVPPTPNGTKGGKPNGGKPGGGKPGGGKPDDASGSPSGAVEPNG
ncbi:MAG: hypothetical protein Q8O61_03480, partial [Nocardioides sp.]|nr:hypothetical protein [Nocardioides sp.]